MTSFEFNANNEHVEQDQDHAQHNHLIHGSNVPVPGRNYYQSETLSMHSMFRSVSMMETPTISFENASHSSNSNSCKFPSRKSKSSPSAIDPDVADTSVPLWTIEHLQALPIYYPLEKTAITLRPSSIHQITDRISQFMKGKSISSIYHNQAGRVDCMTSNLLHFSVQLWKGKSGREDASMAGPSCSEVIVEIQRRQGCCIEMQRLRQDLICFLTHPTNGSNESTVSSNKFCAHTDGASVQFMQKIVEQMTQNDGAVALPALNMDDCGNAYSICVRLLESRRFDECRLGLESLGELANPRKVLSLQAFYVASKVLTDPQLQSLLVRYFANTSVNQSNEDNNDHGADVETYQATVDYSNGRFFGEMHILALKAVSNALDTALYFRTKTEESGIVARINLLAPFWNRLLEAMVYNVDVYYVRPLESCLSVHCLRRLHKLFPQRLINHPVIANESNFGHCLVDARLFGKKHYSALERESNEFLRQLGLAY
jgi:hypothetical protein